ncbi:969_t:CDS:2, partial [Scutellospora calospora]
VEHLATRDFVTQVTNKHCQDMRISIDFKKASKSEEEEAVTEKELGINSLKNSSQGFHSSLYNLDDEYLNNKDVQDDEYLKNNDIQNDEYLNNNDIQYFNNNDIQNNERDNNSNNDSIDDKEDNSGNLNEKKYLDKNKIIVYDILDYNISATQTE